MKSMTAYAYVHKKKKDQIVQVIFRSLNFKYLDVNVHNLPLEKILLEEKIKREIKKKIRRGKIEVYIFLKRPVESNVRISETTLASYLAQTKKVAKKFNLKAELDIRDFLNLPQVVYLDEKKEPEENLIFPAIEEGMRRLLEFKEKEGRIIKSEMLKNLKSLATNMKGIKLNKPSVRREDNNKEDIDEEIALGSFYIKRVEEKIKDNSPLPKGKSIDFLTQEILRELNAASSKTKKQNAAMLIVEAKNYLERIREQAQNIE
ncbi:MAG: DUF1732 domain-containing protein [Candidatus Omnitrophota bacterium]|nr:DUF1732 domain-containing protein [Candidatus Omnitrophota bacterium]